MGAKGRALRRRVRARGDGVRVPDRPRALHGDDAGRHPHEARPGAGAGAGRVGDGGAAQRRPPALPGQGARRPVAVGRRVRRRPRARPRPARPRGPASLRSRRSSCRRLRQPARTAPVRAEPAVGRGPWRGGARRAGPRRAPARSRPLWPGARVGSRTGPDARGDGGASRRPSPPSPAVAAPPTTSPAGRAATAVPAPAPTPEEAAAPTPRRRPPPGRTGGRVRVYCEAKLEPVLFRKTEPQGRRRLAEGPEGGDRGARRPRARPAGRGRRRRPGARARPRAGRHRDAEGARPRRCSAGSRSSSPARTR